MRPDKSMNGQVTEQWHLHLRRHFVSFFELRGLKFLLPALVDGRLQLLEIRGIALVLGAVQCTLQAIKRCLGRGEQKQCRYQQS